jgi:hypothetical protein
LLFRAEGLRAVSVDADHKTHLRPLQIGRDYGVTLEVIQGLNADDWIVVNPADSIEEGAQVNVKQLPQNNQPVPAGAPSGNASAPQPSNGAAAHTSGTNSGQSNAPNSGGNNSGNNGKSKKGAAPKQK